MSDDVWSHLREIPLPRRGMDDTRPCRPREWVERDRWSDQLHVRAELVSISSLAGWLASSPPFEFDLDNGDDISVLRDAVSQLESVASDLGRLLNKRLATVRREAGS